LKIPVANVWRLLTPQTHPGHVCPPRVSIAYGLGIQLLLNQGPLCFWNCVWSFPVRFETTRCALKAVSL